MQAGDQTFSTWGWDIEGHSRTKVYYNLKGRRRYNTELSTCFAGKQDGRRPESRATIPIRPAPLSRNCPVVTCSHALTDAKPKQKFSEILRFQTVPPPQWKSMAVYFNGGVSVFRGIDYK